MRIVKNWKRSQEPVPADSDPIKFVVSPITGELILMKEMAEHMRISLIDRKYREQKERMMAKIRETTLAHDDEISRNIVGLAGTRPDIFGTTEEEVSNAVKAEIEKKKEEQPKQVIWDDHTGSIGRTANQAMSQALPDEEQFDSANNKARNIPGPAPLPNSGMPAIRPQLPLSIPRPPGAPQCSIPTSIGIPNAPLPRTPVLPMIPLGRLQPPTLISLPQLPPNVRPQIGPPISVTIPSVPVPPPPGSQFTPLPSARPFVPTVPQPPLPRGVPPPPPEEAPPPLPEEPEPTKQRVDGTVLIPEDQFLARHPGSVCISVSVPNIDEGNLKGQILDISIKSLAETIGSMKAKIAGEVQLPANKQKLSGQAGFLKDTMSLAYHNIGLGETLTLSLKACSDPS